jgi:hypothetical protein
MSHWDTYRRECWEANIREFYGGFNAGEDDPWNPLRRNEDEPEESDEWSLADRLCITTWRTGLSYADKSILIDGQQAKRIAFLTFSDLLLEFFDPDSPLRPLIEADAAKIQARVGEQYDALGYIVELGGVL